MIRQAILAAGVAGAFLVGAASAAVPLTFTAVRTNLPGVVANPNGVCPNGPTLEFIPGAPVFNQGTSNLGNFTATIFECPTGPSPSPNVGSSWWFEFVDGTLFGTKSGRVTGGSASGFQFVSDFVVTGGTGFFEGATGGFAGVGGVVFGRTPLAIENLSGTINVDEPSTLASIAVGLGLLGCGMQARRRTKRV